MPMPDAVFTWSAEGEVPRAARPDDDDEWAAEGAVIRASPAPDGLRLSVTSHSPLSGVAVRWNRGLPEGCLVLGDAWERSYGDLRWEPPRAERALPWYWIATEPGGGIRGAGVRVRPTALCSWTADTAGVTLWLDVRSGDRPLELGERELALATLVELESHEGTAFDALGELCAALCSDPIVPDRPVFGSNNWYYAYGVGFDADAVLRDAETVVRAAEGTDQAPFCVIDAGWSEGGTAPGGPWDRGMGTFSEMADVAARIRAAGALPGLWFRPLLSRRQVPGSRHERLDGDWPLDPSRPETLALVAESVARFRDWGYELIKHDFSTYDVFGRFLQRSDHQVGAPRWSFADARRTTAEILIELYRTIHDAADGAIVLGCNTIGHLAAGLEHIHRIGDDTSGREWERTRRMGVNTLAFRLAQNRRFFLVDADCVPSTPQTPWARNREFLELVAAGGTATFVSIDPKTLTDDVAADIARAAQRVLAGDDAGGIEPLDWQSASTPRRWRVGDEHHVCCWEQPWGADIRAAAL
ncbi:MAG: hypothetical protein FWD85_00955 [Microbacteriaceae bacterium]|nr:hypothetical protein [Microbacteriaceae bacterium]MCL2793855.1 hypothetical protein [Microbacteriaceae bacterium]